jgi:hypothetical protein
VVVLVVLVVLALEEGQEVVLGDQEVLREEDKLLHIQAFFYI